MSLMDKIRSWFRSGHLPEETRLLIEEADSPDAVLRKLDELSTQNEFKYKELDREIGRLDSIEADERQKVAEGQVDGRQKRNTLLYIRRLRKQMDLYENRLKIYDRNMNLHINLMAKIQDMQAMAQRGVDEEKIDAIIQDYEENFERYMNAVIGGEAAFDSLQRVTSDERSLMELEREIMGTKKPEVEKPEPAVEEPAREEKPVREKPKVEKPAVVKAETESEAKEPERTRVPIDEAMEAHYERIDREIEELEKELELE